MKNNSKYRKDGAKFPFRTLIICIVPILIVFLIYYFQFHAGPSRDNFKDIYFKIKDLIDFQAVNPKDSQSEEFNEIGLHKGILGLINETENLSKSYFYSREKQIDVTTLDSDSYATLGYNLKKYYPSAPDYKNKLMALDRQALMFLIASEIELQKGNMNISKLVEENCLACRSAIKIYENSLSDQTKKNYREWLRREDIKWLLNDRLAECLAQKEFIMEGSSKKELIEIISSFPKGYTAKHKFCKNEIYSRIGVNTLPLECN